MHQSFAPTLIAVMLAMTTAPGISQGAETLGAETLGAETLGDEIVLAFESDLHDGIHEGYVTLKWNKVAEAETYRVIGPDAELVYEGHLNQAFLSGLSDGTFEYRVQAVSSAGSTIATSSPTKVIVAHWSLRQAFGLFGIGLIVMLSVVVVLICGSRRVSGEVAE